MSDTTDNKSVSPPLPDGAANVKKKHHSAEQRRVRGRFASTGPKLAGEELVDHLTLLAGAHTPALKKLIKLSKSRNEQVALRASKSVCELFSKSGYQEKSPISPLMQGIIDDYGRRMGKDVQALVDEQEAAKEPNKEKDDEV